MSDSKPASTASPEQARQQKALEEAELQDLKPFQRAAKRGMVNVQIDGTWIEVPKGTRMIEACRIAGKNIPHYCYHPKLTSPGNCRMCLVEMGMPPRLTPGQEPSYDADGYQPIGWIPRPTIACANFVAENMGIRTEGALTEACRNGVMEFLLINHPLDCPICDQAGECRLQEYSVAHGRGYSRFVEDKVKKPKSVRVGPRVRLDDERCIMCSRCIRFMDEVADDPVLGFTQRGSYTTLTIDPERKLDSNYSLNTVDICPVGALTSEDFRFQMRVWFLRETESIDPCCGTGTNILISARQNEVERITPRRNDEVNSTWMPDNHRMAYKLLTDPARLTLPSRREDRCHQPTDWPTALAGAAEALGTLDGAKIALVASGRCSNEELFLTRLLAARLGVPAEQIDVVPRTGGGDNILIAPDANPNTTGARIVLGVEKPGSNLAGIRTRAAAGELDGLIVLRENLFKEAGFSADEIARPGFVLCADVLANPTADLSDVVLPLAAWAEERGSYVNLSGRAQRFARAVQPPFDARAGVEALADLLELLGGAHFADVDAVWKSLATEVNELDGLSWHALGPQGRQVLETGYEIPCLVREKERIEHGIING